MGDEKLIPTLTSYTLGNLPAVMSEGSIFLTIFAKNIKTMYYIVRVCKDNGVKADLEVTILRACPTKAIAKQMLLQYAAELLNIDDIKSVPKDLWGSIKGNNFDAVRLADVEDDDEVQEMYWCVWDVWNEYRLYICEYKEPELPI